MSKIKLLSDLHLEFKVDLRSRQYFPYNDEEVLILAGDIHSGASNCITALKQFHAEGYRHIVYVPGNHEYYSSGSISDFNAKLRRFSEENKWLSFLNKDWCASEETKSIFIGAPLWTNFGNNPVSALAAKRGITDFRVIDGFTPDDCAEMYYQDSMYIKNAIKSLHELFPEYKLYVVTHFLPAKVCIAPEYKSDPAGLNNYFANDLDNYLFDEVPPGLTWVFGHTHTPCDFQHGNTRLVANPYGYHLYENQRNFNNRCYV